jgi:hypothetical protein
MHLEPESNRPRSPQGKLSMDTPVRWTFVRKIALLNEIRAGRLSPGEALVQFGIGSAELSRWQELSILGGEAALMAGQVQKYRLRWTPKMRQLAKVEPCP